MKKNILLFVLCWFSLSVYPQDAEKTIEQLIADIFEQYTEESDVSVDYESFYEDLMYCAQNPINLNATSREELRKLQFLNDIQIENIQAYIYQYGPLKELYQLQLIEGLDMTDIRRMLPFVKTGKGADEKKKFYARDLLSYGRNQLLIRLDKGMQLREGYRPGYDEETGQQNTTYEGNDWYNSLKYRYHFKDKIQIGVTAEKDEGEQFWGRNHKGYDFYSGYAQIANTGKINSWVVGDFRAGFGMGLVLQPSFSVGKSAYVLNVMPKNTGIRKYSSTDESNFFRGTGATFRFGQFELTGFASFKKLDADTAGGVFKSIYRTGNHRTASEIANRHTVNEFVTGGNVVFRHELFQAGFSIVHVDFNKRLRPEQSIYNHYFFSGKSHTSAGINYRIHWKKLNLFGETATTANGGLATMNGCYFSPASRISLVLVQRYYSIDYNAIYASSFSENSRVNNESGVYIGAEIHPVRKWKIATYADSYRFMWPRFGVDAPATGCDYLVQTEFAPRRTLSMYWRIRYKIKEQTISTPEETMPVITPVKKASFRYQLAYSIGQFDFKNILENNIITKSVWTKVKYGVIASQDISCTLPTLHLHIDFRYLMFDVPEYDNRIYAYENDVLYAFSVPAYYGHGSRCYLNVRYVMNKVASFWVKIAQTIYADDREYIGSGDERINGRQKSDIRLVAKLEF